MNKSERFTWLSRLTTPQLLALCAAFANYRDAVNLNREQLITALSKIEGIENPRTP